MCYPSELSVVSVLQPFDKILVKEADSSLAL